MSDAVPDSSMNTFVELSSVLTGYAREVLAPPFDSIDLKSLYYQTAQQAQGAVFDQILSTFAQIMSTTPPDQWPQEVQEKILSDATLGPAARQILKLWFVGIWYDPPDQINQGQIVSMQAYVGGLVWDTIQAHPMGDSQFPFGYWGSDPPPPGPFPRFEKGGGA